MKSDFAMAQEKLSQIGIVRVSKDFYAEPKRRGACYFVKSPSTPDKTASLALYPNSNRFCDFANGNHSGDIVSFISYVRGCNNWQALKELKDVYGLMDSREQNNQEAQRRILLQQQEEKKKIKRQQEFKAALFGEIDHLKRWENIYKIIMKKQIYEPFTSEWCYCIKEQQQINLQLDILCAIDSKMYVRMKPNPSMGLSSDRPQWLLDVLSILAEHDAFKATKAELEEIITQRDFELTRKSGIDRRCSIEW